MILDTPHDKHLFKQEKRQSTAGKPESHREKIYSPNKAIKHKEDEAVKVSRFPQNPKRTIEARRFTFGESKLQKNKSYHHA